MKISADKVLLDNSWAENRTISIENGIVTSISGDEPADLHCAVCVPGLIDQHVHGGFGADIMNATEEAIHAWLRFLLRNGVTQVLAGVYTYPVSAMREAMQRIRNVMNQQAAGIGGALLTGVHLEGPFISRQALGAMDEETVLEPTIRNYHRLVDGYEDIVRLVTIAPEEPGATELIEYITSRGIPCEAGHTHATSEEGFYAFNHGITGITHFFNASTPIHHRKPGILTAALLDDRIYTECICDFVHVHPDAIRLIYRCKGAKRMIVISDAVYTTGLPDGEYTSGRDVTVVIHGESRTPAGNLNGGGMVVLQEVQNLISIGISPLDAFTMASRTPAEYLGIDGGIIREGSRAELLCLTSDLKPVLTVCGKHTSREENV